jgi:hypothetical protein
MIADDRPVSPNPAAPTPTFDAAAIFMPAPSLFSPNIHRHLPPLQDRVGIITFVARDIEMIAGYYERGQGDKQ